MAWFSRFNRSTRLVAVGGLTLGVGFGAMAAVTAATSPSPGAQSGADQNGVPGPHLHGRPGHAVFLNSAGTLTAINGGTLTLRTEEGTETVTTSTSTQYRKLRQTIQLSDLHVNDIVRVRLAAGSTPPAQPGTGTVAAAAIDVVEPALAGRVTGIDGDTVHLVGAEGRFLTVTLTGTTRYYNGRQAADRSAVVVNAHIVAQGDRDSLTHLTADLVTVLPADRGRARAGVQDFLPGGAPFPLDGAVLSPDGPPPRALDDAAV